MCTTDGFYILDTVLQGKKVMTQSASINDEIVQEKPDVTAWNEWKKFLKTLCYKGSDSANSFRALATGTQ